MTASTPPRSRALAGTVAAILLPIVAVVALHRFGSEDWLRIDFSDLGGWMRRSRVEDAFAAVLRYVALTGAYWLAGSSAFYLLARLSGVTQLIDFAAILALPAVRRATDRLVIGTIAISSLAGPAVALSQWDNEPKAAMSADPIAMRLEAEDGTAVTPPQGTQVSESEASTPSLHVPPVDRLAPVEPGPGPASITIRADAHLEVVVTEGDHLWSLAERHMSALLGRPAFDHEVAPYWREVISSNPGLRSGDPDLIFPGEVIVLPPLG